MNTATDFLQQLRSGGPWVLTAIKPDGPTETITATTEEEVEEFIRKHNGKRNLYYSLNPTKGPMTKKAAKTDIAAIEYLLADLDPNPDETPTDARTRYLRELSSFMPAPTAIVNSGNGIQGLWRLVEPIVLSDDAEPIIGDVEARTEAIMVRLGAKPGTQNIDRILRLPGTINLPNKKKQKEGRVECEAGLIQFNGASYPLGAFPLPEQTKPGTPDDGGHHAPRQEHDDDTEDTLARTIRTGGNVPIGERSEEVWKVINEMLRRGYLPETIIKTLLDRRNGISAHIYAQNNPPKYAKRQVEKAQKEITFYADPNSGAVLRAHPANICIALLKLGVSLRYDRFADRILIHGLPDFGPSMDDAATIRIWRVMDQRWRFRPAMGLLQTILKDIARLNAFHPVRDYLDGLKWDGTPRLDTWLIKYGGAEDNEYTRAVGALILTAAVRRVRQPGVKFDEMLVFENPDQGTDKSSALSTLAVRDEWFTDNMALNIKGKEVIEQLRGRWIIECAELTGMRRADIEHVKAQLSRQTDRARMVYAHFVSDVPRECVFFGTTNSTEFLADTTGNRRFWPVRLGKFDVAALRRDRDQLWAEAAQREAGGVSIRLDQKLWSVAAEEQDKRHTPDPWLDMLQTELGDKEGKITMESIWVILDVHPSHRTQAQSVRVGEAMRKLGWTRPKNRQIKVHGKDVAGFVRGGVSAWVYGERQWPLITAQRLEGILIVKIETV